MIRHILLINWKEGITESQKGEAIKATMGLESLDCMQHLVYGEKIGLVQDSYDFAVIMDFASEGDWHTYQSHPTHVASADLVRPLVAEFARIQIPA